MVLHGRAGTVTIIKQSGNVHTWVDAGLGFKLAVAVDLSTTNKDGLNPHQLADGEGEVEAQVLCTVQLHLSSIHPG